MIKLPEQIRATIGERAYTKDQIGRSDSQVICFDDMVLKIELQKVESDNEHVMMKWLEDRLPVPRILCLEQMDHANYLLMSRVEGQMLCSNEYLENPMELVRLLSQGLKMLWNVDITDCPYNNCVDNKLRFAEMRVANNLCTMEDAQPDTYGEDGFTSPLELLTWLKENKPVETPAFSHGDYCLPNIFAKNHGISGFIDLGRSGVADKYQDIALCYRSLKYNLGGQCGSSAHTGFHPDMLFEQLGIEPDWQLIRYYTLLDELF